MKVLITDASYRNTLAAVRALGREGVKVVVGGEKGSKGSYSQLSKYSQRMVTYTSPTENVDRFIDDLLKILKMDDYDLLMPIGIATTISISYHLEELIKHVNIPIVTYDRILKAHDKLESVKIAQKIGFPTPDTFWPKNLDELKELAEKISYPVVVKPRKGCGTFEFSNTPKELIETYQKISNIFSKSKIISDYKYPIIQEFIPGKIHDLLVLFDKKSNPVAALTQVRLKTVRPNGSGAGVVNQTTYEPELNELGIRLLKEIKWYGVAMVEVILDERDNSYKLMEINPKFWGTLDLSIKAGINFPYLLCQVAMGNYVDPINGYRIGLRYRWLNDELRTEASSVLEFMNFFQRNTVYDFDFEDPKPSISQLYNSLRKKIVRS